jgi:hypothetical protein
MSDPAFGADGSPPGRRSPRRASLQMPDDKVDDKYQRSFEIEYVATINGITKRQAVELIKKYGNDYAAIAREAKWLRD